MFGPHTAGLSSSGEPKHPRHTPVRGKNRILGSLKSAMNRWPRIVNIAMLIAGLGLGQGAIFVVQTVLLASNKYELIATFGTHYSFAMLSIIVVDGGATTILARAVAGHSIEMPPRDDVWRIYCETSVIRLLAALMIGAVAVSYVLQAVPDSFSTHYVIFAVPGLLLWSGNAVGVLDGLRLSGVSGITGSAAYILTAIGLALAADRPADVAGSILGGSFSLGYLFTLSAQWFVLGRRGWRPQLRRVTRAGLLRSMKDSTALLFQLLPGQINMRVQLILSATYLGPQTTALFIYAKQIVTAATQIIAFVLRVDFPALIEEMAASTSHSFASILKAQKTTFWCAIALTIGATAVSGIAAMMPDFKLHGAATIIASFAPTILTLSVSLMMNQALAALGAYRAVALSVAIGTAAGILVSYLTVTSLHTNAFVLGEVTLHLVGLSIAYIYLCGRRSPPGHGYDRM